MISLVRFKSGPPGFESRLYSSLWVDLEHMDGCGGGGGGCLCASVSSSIMEKSAVANTQDCCGIKEKCLQGLAHK